MEPLFQSRLKTTNKKLVRAHSLTGFVSSTYYLCNITLSKMSKVCVRVFLLCVYLCVRVCVCGLSLLPPSTCFTNEATRLLCNRNRWSPLFTHLDFLFSQPRALFEDEGDDGEASKFCSCLSYSFHHTIQRSHPLQPPYSLLITRCPFCHQSKTVSRRFVFIYTYLSPSWA